MRRRMHWPFAIACLLVSTQAWAQPTITSITPGYGGAGPNSPASYTIIGTGFQTQAKFTRFVDASGKDLFETVSCSTATTCTASGVRPFLAAAGVVSTLQVKATTAGVATASGVSFIYYGTPTVASVSPNAGAIDTTTPYVLNGAAFTSLANGFPGTTSIQLGSSTVDLASGCGTTTSCAGSAPGLAPSTPMGVTPLEIRTPGGTVRTSFTYGGPGQFPATPTITSISVSTGPAAGGNTLMISGTNFITGVRTLIPSFGVSRGTSFNFISPAGASVTATSVNCPATTRCYVTVPSGAAGPAGLEAYTVCDAFTAPCSLNGRPSVSQSSTISRGLYAYAGIKLWPGANGPIVVSESGNAYQGRPTTYNVSLYGPPTANVHVDISVVPGVATVSPASLDFTPMNWAEPQTVTVNGLNDSPTATGDTAFTIQNIASSADASYSGVESDQPAINVDNDTKRVIITPQAIVTTRSGGGATFNIVITQRPTLGGHFPPGCDLSSAYMTLTSSNPAAGTVTNITADPPPPPIPWPALTFDTEPGSPIYYTIPRIVTVSGHDDGTPGTRRDYTMLTTIAGDWWANGCPTPTGPGGYALVVPADVHVINIDAAGAPSGIVLTRTGLDRAVVTWNLNAASDFYRIKYSTTPGGAKTLLASSAMSGQAITGLTFGQPYYFVISGVNDAGESADSAEVPFIIAPPGPVGGFDADAKSEMTYYTGGGNWQILNSTSGYTTSTTVHLGGVGLTPVMGDYDGDRRQDAAVYSPATGDWTIVTSSSGFVSTISVNWGSPGDLPVPGDYDGDGRIDPAVYRLSDGQWSALKSSTNYTQSIVAGWGGAGYIPVPGQDFDGDYRADIAVYHPSSGAWYALLSAANYTTAFGKIWGGAGVTLVPGDYDGDGKADLGLYERASGGWRVLLSGAGYTTTITASWGGFGYLPAPGDYDGDGKIDLGVFAQASGNWIALVSSAAYTTAMGVTAWGTSADRVISSAIFVGGDDTSRAADFDADHAADITVYGTGSGLWSSLSSRSGYVSAISRTFGGSGYTAVTGDYDGDGTTDHGTYQASTGNWSILLSSSSYTTVLNKSVGGPGWLPVPGDYDGDGRTDFVVYNATTGQWFGLKSSASYTTTVNISYGGTGYTAVVGDFEGDGKTDIGVYQDSTGLWSVLTSSSNYTSSIGLSVGGAGYVPVQGDYDGDRKADFVVYNTSTSLWYGLKSSTNYTTTINVLSGATGSVPVKGDFDGDGMTDLATYQTSTGAWSVRLSSVAYATVISRTFGGAGYVPVPQYP